MANYNSIPQRFNEPKSRINHKYIDATLKQKQNTIDGNFGLMQQQVEKVLGQDFVHPEDAEMLKSKVSDVLTNLQQTDSIKFDSKKARFMMQDALTEASKDPEVLEQIANTKKVRAFNSSVEEAKKNGTYNENNYQASVINAGLDKYMLSGENRQKKLGSLNYVPYYDSSKEAFENINKINSQYNKPITETKLDPNSYPPRMITTTRRPLTSQQVEVMARKMLSDKAKYQFAIDGAAKFGFTQEKARDFVTNKLQDISQEKTDRLANIENMLNTDGISKNQKNQLLNRKRDIKTYYNSREEEYENLQGKRPMAVGRALQEGFMLNNLLPKDYGVERITASKADEVFFQNEKLKIARAKLKLQEKTMLYQKEIALIKATNSENPINKTNKKSSNDELSNDDIQVVAGSLKPKADKPFVDMAFDNMNSSIASSNNSFRAIKNKFPSKYNEALDELKKNAEKNGTKLTDDEFTLNKDVVDYMFNKGDLETIEAKRLVQDYDEKYYKAYSKFNTFNEDYNKAVSQAKEDVHQSLFETLNEQSAIIDTEVEIIGPNGSNINLREDFKNKGITNGEELRKYIESEEGKYLKANVLLSDVTDILGRINTSTSTLGVSDHRNHNKLQKIKELLGFTNTTLEEDLTPVFHPREYTDFYKFIDSYGNKEHKIHFSYSTTEDIKGELQDYLDIDEIEKTDRVRDIRVRQYNNKGITEIDNNIIGIKGNTDVAKSFSLFDDLGISSQNKENIFLKQDPLNEDKIEVYTSQEIVGAKEEGSTKKNFKTVKKGSVNKSEIKNKGLLNKIDLLEEKENFNFKAQTNMKSRAPRYSTKDEFDSKSTYLEYMRTNSNDTQKRAEADLTTFSGADNLLTSTVDALKQFNDGKESTINNIDEANNLKDFYLDNYSDFRIKLKGSKELGNKLQIIYKKDDGKEIEISTSDFPKNFDTKEFNHKFSNYPSVLMAQEMKKVLTYYTLRAKRGLNSNNIDEILSIKEQQDSTNGR